MTSAEQLKCLPPTEDALTLNIKRAHYQCSIWRNVELQTAALLRVEDYGWTKDIDNKCLDPTPLLLTTPIAPAFLMKITFCNCSSSEPCTSQNCSCRKANLKCSELCRCKGNCCNGEPATLESIDEFITEEESDDELSEDESQSFFSEQLSILLGLIMF